MPKTRGGRPARSTTGLASIGEVVERLRPEFPDLTVSSLRFLERAGLLAPARSRGRQRLFAPEDIARIRQIKRWQAQRLSLAAIRERLQTLEQFWPGDDLGSLYREALLAGEVDRARGLVRQAHDSGLALPDLCEQIFQPALVEIGRLWAEGEVSVAQEHQAAAVTRDLLAEIVASTPPGSPRNRTALAACVAGEHHELGLKMIAAALDLAGWQVDYLGADVPGESLLRLVQARKPDLLVLSATIESNLPQAAALIRELATWPAEQRPYVLLGGQAVDRHPEVRGWSIDCADGQLRDVLAWIDSTFGDNT